MNATGRRLAFVQLEGMKSIDREFGPLSVAIAAVVMRYATPDQHGILRLTLPARALILAEVGRLLDQTRGKLLPVILASVQAARAAAQEDTEPIPVPVTEQIETITTVSRALQTDRQSVLDQTGALLLVGIAGKLAASVVARQVRQYFSPFFSTYRDENSKLLHTDRLGAVQHWPGRAGMASAHARLTMLTETTRSHAEATRKRAERDGLYLKWNLSPQHTGTDACSDHADRDDGLGKGVYTARNFPRLPEHPNCRCYASTVTP